MSRHELPAEVNPEGAPRKESPRDLVINAFNRAAYSWARKIDGIHQARGSELELDDLVRSGRLTEGEREQVVTFRLFEKEVRYLTRSGYLRINRHMDNPHSVVRFRNNQTEEEYEREEGIDISGLIESAREDVKTAEMELERVKGYSYSLQFSIQRHEEDLQLARETVRVLEDNSKPFTEIFPDTFDESNPVSKARIEDEAGLTQKNDLTDKGSRQANWEEGKARLGRRRVLIIPEKEAVITDAGEQPITESGSYTDVPDKTGSVGEITPRGDPSETGEQLDDFGPYAYPPEEARKIFDSGVSKGAWGEMGLRGLNEEVLVGEQEPQPGGRSRFKEFGEMVRKLQESGSAKTSDFIEGIRGVRKDLVDRIPDPEIREKVERLKRVVKLPKADRRLLAVGVLATAVSLLALLTPRD
ncbi:MAG: hypothetical protein M1142_00005 [Patescibacteria group bacterium]|nr:hypothetical protein [Patescibacteria group bacterium]